MPAIWPAFWLQTAAPNALMQFLPLVLIVIIFYLLVFMPMQKQKKTMAAMLESLSAGNEILTTGGIIGTVVSVAQDTLIVRVKPDNIKLQIARSSVASLVNPPNAVEKAEGK
ncbi:MAG: preprotein translocase subunit YajC [Acidobacteriota bacterium]